MAALPIRNIGTTLVAFFVLACATFVPINATLIIGLVKRLKWEGKHKKIMFYIIII